MKNSRRLGKGLGSLINLGPASEDGSSQLDDAVAGQPSLLKLSEDVVDESPPPSGIAHAPAAEADATLAVEPVADPEPPPPEPPPAPAAPEPTRVEEPAEPAAPEPPAKPTRRFEDEYVRPQLDLFLGEAPPVWAEQPQAQTEAPQPAAAATPAPSPPPPPDPGEEPPAEDPSLAVFVDETFVLLDEEVGGLAFPEVDLE